VEYRGAIVHHPSYQVNDWTRLHAAGLAQLATGSLADYQALASKLADDRALLASMRQKLAKARQSCTLFDTELFTRHIEAAYTMMVRLERSGEKPRGFVVGPIAGGSGGTA
jgi:hypothetical protein